jgi:hypothetical protein
VVGSSVSYMVVYEVGSSASYIAAVKDGVVRVVGLVGEFSQGFRLP